MLWKEFHVKKTHMSRTEVVTFNNKKILLKKLHSFINGYVCHLNKNIWKLRTVILKSLIIELIYIFEKNISIYGLGNSPFAENSSELLFQRVCIKNIVRNIFSIKTCTTIKQCLIVIYRVTLLFHNEEKILSL